MKKNKAKDIARGVLPSTARKAARDDKRAFHATHRAEQRKTNRAIQRHLAVEEDGTLHTDPDLFDDFEDPTTFDGYTAATTKASISWDNMKDIVSSRRDHDNLGALLSWARATEKKVMSNPDWDVADKIAYFKAILPDTLQGRHALGHVQSALDLDTDPFYYGYRYRNPVPVASRDKFRATLLRRLSSSKGRLALHDFLLETVPVAGHTAQTNNKVLTQVQAVDENGNKRYLPATSIDPQTGRITHWVTPRSVMVDVYVPQIVATTCDDCSFLRNDPLTSPPAVNRFVDFCWSGRFADGRWNYRYRRPARPASEIKVHVFTSKIVDHILETSV